MKPNPLPGRGELIAGGLRRRCPRCGEGAFVGWFQMKEFCSRCGFRFEREPGYWVGAVIVNTTVVFATFIVVFGGMVLATFPDVPWGVVLTVTVVANIIIPVFFYPISKTVWAAIELSWHPLEPEEIEAAASRTAS